MPRQITTRFSQNSASSYPPYTQHGYSIVRTFAFACLPDIFVNEIINKLSSAEAACPLMCLTRFSKGITCLGSEVCVLPRPKGKIDNSTAAFATMQAMDLHVSRGIATVEDCTAYRTNVFSCRDSEERYAPHMVPSIPSRTSCSPGFCLCSPSTEGFQSLRAPFFN